MALNKYALKLIATLAFATALPFFLYLSGREFVLLVVAEIAAVMVAISFRPAPKDASLTDLDRLMVRRRSWMGRRHDTRGKRGAPTYASIWLWSFCAY